MLDTAKILEKLYNVLGTAVHSVYDRETLSDHLKAISIETPSMASAIIEVGEEYNAILLDKENVKPTDADKYILLYYWMEETKNFMILWRDIQLEGTKAYHYQQDNLVDHISIKKMLDQSKAMLLQSLEAIKTVFPHWKAELELLPDKLKSQILNWDKQINPWPEYRLQFKALTEQVRSISNLSNQLGRSNGNYKHIRRILQSYIDKRKNNMSEISRCSELALESVRKLEQGYDASLLNKKVIEIEGIHKTLNQLFIDIHHLEQIEKIIDEMADNIEVPIASQNGLLKIKKLSLKKNTQQWLESEIYLILYEIEEVEDQLKNKLKMILVNIQNHIALLKNDSAESQGALLQQAIKKFKKEYIKISTKHNRLIRNAKTRLDNDLRLSEIFNQERLFLPASVQSTLGNLDLGRTKLRHKASEWLKDTFFAYDILRKKAKSERNLSASEKLVRYVDSRQFDPENRQYINIFLVKGYIGESFVIGRQEELDHFRNVYDSWLNGYRGSIVVTGQRFSGKSLFVEYANIKVLDGKAIQLKPNMEFEINGRVHTATYDLQDTLNTITKYSYDTKPAVFIDDIELWYNRQYTLSKNIRALCKIIDRYSSKIFFVVTMSNWFQHKMNNVYGLDRVFQADINLDRMTLDEIKKVISIRQGATHKDLLNKQEKKVTAEEFEKIAKRIHQNVDGNVGDALSKWAANTHHQDTNSVIMGNRPFYTIPDIDHKDTLLILETIMMSRKTNEYFLNQYFGDAFKHTYGTLLQRLVNVGLITRNVDNLIQINPKVVNDVGRLLDTKNYLTFNHR